jgi:hypothetical protein
MIDYTAILSRRYKGKEWTLDGNDYDGLTWLSDTAKPTKATLDALWAEVKSEIDAEPSQLATAREAVLTKLGLTADEVKVLLS